MDIIYKRQKNEALTPSQIAELNALKERPIEYDEDAPKYSYKELLRLKKLTQDRNIKLFIEKFSLAF